MRGKTALTKEQYLARFAFAARWYLGEKDGADAVADYEELTACGEEGALCARFGTPRRAARLLADRKNYGAWLAVGLVLLLCAVMTLAELCMAGRWGSVRFGAWTVDGNVRASLYLGVGMLVSLFWFRKRNGGQARVPARLKGALAALVLAGAALGLYIAALCAYTVESAENGTFTPQLEAQVFGMNAVIRCAGVLLLAAALAALVLARCRDRRWRAVYVLALTGLAMLAAVMLFFCELSDPQAFLPALRDCLVPLALVGLVGTGVSLC